MNYKIKVGVIILNEEEEILLIKEKTEKVNRPLWNIIKGTYGDVRGESIFAAAKRECLEEAGAHIILTALCGCYISHTDNEVWTQFTFLAKLINQSNIKLATKDEQKVRNENISEFKWFSESEIKKLNEEDFISPKIHQIVLDYLGKNKYELEAIKQI